jgi:hypothetical protein
MRSLAFLWPSYRGASSSPEGALKNYFRAFSLNRQKLGDRSIVEHRSRVSEMYHRDCAIL